MAMGGLRGLLLLRIASLTPTVLSFHGYNLSRRISPFAQKKGRVVRSYSAKCGLDPPDVSRLAETARISLTPNEVEEFAPKIRQVVDWYISFGFLLVLFVYGLVFLNWFGQLQAVNLESIEPAIRADTEDDNLHDDLPQTFQNREALIAAVPSYNEPFIKVPKVLNKE